MSSAPFDFDAVVIGGGPAGLSAALALGRAMRRVLVASCGAPRNAPTHAAHNVFTRDGTPPAELLRIGREQLAPYQVELRDECATDVQPVPSGFVVRVGNASVRTQGIILATGVRDVLPELPGLEGLWGTGVFHCPYCHGWEVANRPLGIYARGEVALHLVPLIRGWTHDLILFTDGPSELSDDDVRRIESKGVVIRTDAVARLEGTDGLDAVVMASGEVIPRAGLFVGPEQEQRSPLAEMLGCAMTPQGRVGADARGRTSVPRVYVAGDAAPGMQSVVMAAASGMMAGAGLNFELLSDDFAA